MLPIGVTIMFEDNLDHSNHAGRTWVRTSVGRTPVGIDTTQTEFNTIGKTGGSKTQSYGLGSGFAKMFPSGDGYVAMLRKEVPSWETGHRITAPVSFVGGLTSTFGIDLGGTTDSGNNLQPYEVFAFWKRTA